MPQYPLNLSLPIVYSADNFFVSDCNREAWQWVEAWPNWPAHALIISGPSGCGKTHLASIWAKHANAFSDMNPAAKDNRVIENIERLSDERALLHLFNASRENKNSLLLTSAALPAQLPFTLPDLTSRLLSIPHAAIDPPDDDALAGVLRKQFTDRQIKIQDDVIAYMLPRMERSFHKTKELVEQLDKQALAEKKNITIPLAKRVMEKIS